MARDAKLEKLLTAKRWDEAIRYLAERLPKPKPKKKD